MAIYLLGLAEMTGVDLQDEIGSMVEAERRIIELERKRLRMEAEPAPGPG